MVKKLRKFLRRWISWPIEALFFYLLLGVMWLLPAQASSSVIGKLMRLVGPLLPHHRRSLFNIGFAMPELSPTARKKIAQDMWENLGRVMGEFIHSQQIMRSNRIRIDGVEHMELLREKGGFMISAHLGNWELAAWPGVKAGLPMNCVYRPINNPLITHVIKRRLHMMNNLYEKGVEGARGLATTVKRKEVFAMVVDQKLREGEMLDFFGHKASTAVAHLKFSQKKNLPILMVQVIRTQGCNFKIVVKPLDLSSIAPDDPEYLAKAGTMINAIIEGWIRENPEQWMWPHRRWPESKGEVYIPDHPA